MFNVNFYEKRHRYSDLNNLISSIYWEQQRGNNCRIHSLNAFFGENKISDLDFEALCNEYDSFIFGLKSIQMDGFAECRSIISYIVDKYSNKYCQLIPINTNGVHNNNRNIWKYERFIDFFGKKNGINAYFEFNRDHVWLNKYIKGEWFKIDSLSGVTRINPLRRLSDNGYLLVFDSGVLFYEIEYLINLIKEYNKVNILAKNDNINSKNESEIEIAFNNLYHLLIRIKLEYDRDNASYNEKVSNLKSIFKILSVYINENRQKRIKNKKIKDLENELNNIINIF